MEKHSLVDDKNPSKLKQPIKISIVEDEDIVINKPKLNASTMTIMVYSNIYLDYAKLFEKLPILQVPVSYTKKKKKPCLKKVKAPYGSIISLRYRNDFKGIIMHPDVVEKEELKKKYLDKQPFTEQERKRVIHFGEERLKKELKREGGYDITEKLADDNIKFFTGIEEICNDGYFLNQLTCVLSIGDKLLNIMIFNNKYKIAGCKNIGQAQEAIAILWHYIKDVEEAVSYIKNTEKLQGKAEENEPEFETIKTILKRENVRPEFIFDIVMTNIDFFIGFPIDRVKLNKLMNNAKYKDIVKMSSFETTGSTNVNIKFHCPKIEKFFNCMTITEDIKENMYQEMLGNKNKKNGATILRKKIENTISIREVKKNIYNDSKTSKSSKAKTSTLLVFESSKTIGSAKDYQTIEEVYNFFIDVVNKNRDLIEEKLIDDKDKFNIRERFGIAK